MSPQSHDEAAAPHPRQTHGLFGHTAAETTLLNAYRSGRIPHAFLIVGPKGIGKATLAYRMARFVMAHPDPAAPEVQAAASLAVDENDPAARRIAAQGQPDLLVIERVVNDKGVLHKLIRVEDVRETVPFFGSTAREGGWRIAIVDAVDELNASGANALLKVLEEPPERALLLLVSHSASRVLPTIRSRCRILTLRPLEPADLGAAIAAATGRNPTIRKSPRLRLLPMAAWRARLRCLTEMRSNCASTRWPCWIACRLRIPRRCTRWAKRSPAPMPRRLRLSSTPSTTGCRAARPGAGWNRAA
jgi:DNA polymerase III gamma/tau subunit